MAHHPVMMDRVLYWLGGISDGVIIDGTLGSGGHAVALLKVVSKNVSILGLDRDPASIERVRRRMAGSDEKIRLVNGSYADRNRIVGEVGLKPVMGFLMDLGTSSDQLESFGRGFSFNDPESLDMRFNPLEGGITASEIVNSWGAGELETVFREYGEARYARRIAQAIVRRRGVRPLRSGRDLAGCISAAVPKTDGHLHPATQVFQSLRIAVNEELEHLKAGLGVALDLLAPDGRMVVISFHSLEDRIVKRFMVDQTGKCRCPDGLPVCVCNPVRKLEILTRRPEEPGQSEMNRNPRSRSAKLRCARKVKAD
ncbi:16S rRNA (cytosine(1402)-N(4))-methyltransferase RsmH [bacterium]|nr:16S rRNA (cytosine(1402)-N(4))-methyltransferase RsmH [candidate division CSSED10-310 bacterium]